MSKRFDTMSEAERRLKKLREDVRRARIWAGDNLPAAAGLEVVIMLEKALKESRT